MLRDITVSSGPHISQDLSTRSVMLDVIIGLVPAMLAAGYLFRLHALMLVATCVISSMVTELLCNLIRKKPNSLDDFSAVVTGIILAFSLPPAFPVWAAVIGSVFAVAIGKMVFGGLGANIFNPAMVGRAFLTASFGMMMTTWAVPATIDSAMPKISAENTIDVRTQATPLAWSKEAQKNKAGAPEVNQQLMAAFTGSVGGCLGETSALALLIGGIYLLIRPPREVRKFPCCRARDDLLDCHLCLFAAPDRYWDLQVAAGQNPGRFYRGRQVPVTLDYGLYHVGRVDRHRLNRGQCRASL